MILKKKQCERATKRRIINLGKRRVKINPLKVWGTAIILGQTGALINNQTKPTIPPQHSRNGMGNITMAKNYQMLVP